MCGCGAWFLLRRFVPLRLSAILNHVKHSYLGKTRSFSRNISSGVSVIIGQAMLPILGGFQRQVYVGRFRVLTWVSYFGSFRRSKFHKNSCMCHVRSGFSNTSRRGELYIAARQLAIFRLVESSEV